MSVRTLSYLAVIELLQLSRSGRVVNQFVQAPLREIVQEALALWEERERGRVEFLATLDEARASLARGEGRAITPESMRELAAEVRDRGRARLIAELAGAR